MSDGSSAYISHNGDIALAQYKTNNPMNEPSTLAYTRNSGTFSSNDNSGELHSIRGYLKTYSAEFISLITAAKTRATAPTATANTGLITVTLTWGSNPDLDLHIIEPSAHVWRGNANGNNGILDIVDSNGNGPEHYYSGCTLETGDYSVKLNYVSGSTHEYPVVTVHAGTEFYQATKDLGSVFGVFGNDYPP